MITELFIQSACASNRYDADDEGRYGFCRWGRSRTFRLSQSFQWRIMGAEDGVRLEVFQMTLIAPANWQEAVVFG